MQMKRFSEKKTFLDNPIGHVNYSVYLYIIAYIYYLSNYCRTIRHIAHVNKTV